MSTIRVLLAEDSPTVLSYFQAFLEGEGFEVTTASDGLDAIGKVYQSIPDVVVSDVEMPVMNGYHLCRFLKSEDETRGIPFVLLTALTEGVYEFWGLEIGADRYLRKESSLDALAATIRELAAASAFDREAVRKVGEKYVTSFHILDRLNRMLDKELRRVTLTGKFTSLAFRNSALADLARELVDTLVRIVHVESLAAVILNTEEIRSFIHAPQAISEQHASDFSSFCLDYLEEKSTINLGRARLEPDCFACIEPVDTPFRAGEVVPFFRRLSDDSQMALFILPPREAPVQRESLELLESLMDHISIAMGHTFMQEKIRSLSVIDSLTRLYNRGHFMALLTAEYRRTIRHNLNLSVIFMDIDNFKSVNDTYGHLCGDMVLKSLSETIVSTIRTSDMAGRYGGEEFVIYLPETNLDNAFMTAERLRRTWENRAIPIGKTQVTRCTMSLGVASVSEVDPGKGVEGMLELSDQKLYRAKQSGKNRVVR